MFIKVKHLCGYILHTTFHFYSILIFYPPLSYSSICLVYFLYTLCIVSSLIPFLLPLPLSPYQTFSASSIHLIMMIL